MKYRDLPQEQKDKRQEIWVTVLDTYCPSLKSVDEDGEEIDFGRPCDQGCPCDRCHYDHNLQQRYFRALAKEGLTLLDKEFIEPSICIECNKDTDPDDLIMVNDRYGIPFKKVCPNCRDRIEAEIGEWEFDPSTGEHLEEEY